MFRNKRAYFVATIAGFAVAALAVWCGLVQPLAALDTREQFEGSKLVAYVYASSTLTKNTDSKKPATAVTTVTQPQPPISCKVAAKGVLTDCRINDGYTLNDVANWFQDEHDRTLQVAVNSLTLAKKLERSFKSCVDKKEKN